MPADRFPSNFYFEDRALSLCNALATLPIVAMKSIGAVMLGVSTLTTSLRFSDPWRDDDRTSIHSYTNTRRKHGRRLTQRQAYALVMKLQARAEAEIREERIAEWERSVAEPAEQ